MLQRSWLWTGRFLLQFVTEAGTDARVRSGCENVAPYLWLASDAKGYGSQHTHPPRIFFLLTKGYGPYLNSTFSRQASMNQ
jgi:hypothetical protein